MTATTFETTTSMPVLQTEQLRESQVTLMLVQLLFASFLTVFIGLFINPIMSIVAAILTAIITPLLAISNMAKDAN